MLKGSIIIIAIMLNHCKGYLIYEVSWTYQVVWIVSTWGTVCSVTFLSRQTVDCASHFHIVCSVLLMSIDVARESTAYINLLYHFCNFDHLLLVSTDVDECLVNNGGCVQLCINLVGSYQCACNIGYEFDSLPEGTLPTPTNTGRACIGIIIDTAIDHEG